MARIFISYRREDTSGYNLSVSEPLKRQFGSQQVFMDLDSIRPGVDFRKVISEAVGSCDAVIALIGKRWLTVEDDAGKRRLDHPEDYVRLEVAAALRREDILVIPALVNGASMPKAEELPDDLRELAYRNALELRDSSFSYDVGRLIDTLRGELGIRKSKIAADDQKGPSTLLAGLGSKRARMFGLPVIAIALIAVLALMASQLLKPGIGPPPAMAMAAPGAGKTLLSDTLSTPVLQTFPTSSTNSHYQLGYGNGGYEIQAKNDSNWLYSNGGVTQQVSGPGNVLDGTVAVDARLVGATANRNLSVWCRWNGTTGYVLWVYPNGQFFHLDRVDSSGNVRLAGATTKAIHANNDWNRLQLSCIGNRISASVNGVRLASKSDNTYPNGPFDIGTGVNAKESDIDARFANLMVTQPRNILVQDTLADNTVGTLSGYTKYPTLYTAQYAKNWYDVNVLSSRWLSGATGGTTGLSDLRVPLNRPARLANGSIAVSAKLLTGPVGRDFDLQCRWNSSTNSGYVLHVNPYPSSGYKTNGSVFLFRVDKNRPTILAQTSTNAVTPGRGWNRIQLSCVGSRISAFVNGTPIVNRQDSTYASGELMLGVGEYSAVSRSEALFANLEVTR